MPDRKVRETGERLGEKRGQKIMCVHLCLANSLDISRVVLFRCRSY